MIKNQNKTTSFISITEDGQVYCFLCKKNLIENFYDNINKVVAIHASAHLRDELDLLPERADKLHGLLNLVIRGVS